MPVALFFLVTSMLIVKSWVGSYSKLRTIHAALTLDALFVQPAAFRRSASRAAFCQSDMYTKLYSIIATLGTVSQTRFISCAQLVVGVHLQRQAKGDTQPQTSQLHVQSEGRDEGDGQRKGVVHQ